MYPRTLAGQLTTIVYAIIGMPLFLLYLSNIGDVMARSFKWIYANFCLCRWCPGVARRRAERKRRRALQMRHYEEEEEEAEEEEMEEEESESGNISSRVSVALFSVRVLRKKINQGNFKKCLSLTQNMLIIKMQPNMQYKNLFYVLIKKQQNKS